MSMYFFLDFHGRKNIFTATYIYTHSLYTVQCQSGTRAYTTRIDICSFYNARTQCTCLSHLLTDSLSEDHCLYLFSLFQISCLVIILIPCLVLSMCLQLVPRLIVVVVAIIIIITIIFFPLTKLRFETNYMQHGWIIQTGLYLYTILTVHTRI